MKPSESWAMTADGAARRGGYAARGELALRQAMEDVLRQRLGGDARICHEMVMGAREVRADVVAICPNHIVAVEIKGPVDNVTRLLHQVGMYQLSVPEVWVVTSRDKKLDAELIRYLMPSVGVMTARDIPQWDVRDWTPDLEILGEPVPRRPHPLMLLEMMWADELAAMARRTAVMTIGSRTPVRAKMIAALRQALGEDELLAACCHELRRRDALWRADPPVGDGKAASEGEKG